MAEALYTNNAVTTLNGAITDAATSITVTDGSVFPNPTGGDYFYLTLSDGMSTEIVKVTARATHVLTVVRGVDGTSGTAFADGDDAQLRLAAAGIGEFARTASLNSANWDTAYSWGDHSLGKADLLVGAGQSNMASSNTQAAGGDLTPNSAVFLWDHAGSAWEVWTPANGYVAFLGGVTETANNILFQAAKYRQRKTNRAQYCILNAWGGQSIDLFVPATATLYADLQTQVTAALASSEMVAISKTAVDRLFYFQGEADSDKGNYGDFVGDLIDQLNAESWYDSGLPLIGFELAPQFMQSDYWANSGSDRNPQTIAVATQDLDYGADGIHLTGAAINIAGVRAAEMSFGGLGPTPLDINIVRPRYTQTAVTFIVGTGEKFETVDAAFEFLSSKWLRDVGMVTLRLAAGAHAAFDTSNFTGGFPIEIRGYDGVATSFPASGALSGGSAAAETEIKAQWASWVECASGDSQGVKLVGDNITLRGLAILANGESVNVGLDVYGKAAIYSCAVHGFVQDQVIIRGGANVDISEVACYGGLRGLTLYGSAYAEIYSSRDNVFVAQTTYAVSLDDGARLGLMCGNDVAEFTGSWCISAARNARGYFYHLTTDTVAALVSISDGADLFIDSINCSGISVGGSPSNTPETFRISLDGKLTIGSSFVIATHNGRFCYNLGGEFRVNGDATVSSWTGTGIEFMRSRYPGSVCKIVGTLAITAETGGGINDIRCDNGGQILTRAISLPGGTSITTSPASNTLQTDGRFISETG